MRKKLRPPTSTRSLADLKKNIIANAVATGNTYAFQDLFAQIKEFHLDEASSGIEPELYEKLAYLMPRDETMESQKFRDAIERISDDDLDSAAISAGLLEDTAREAIMRGKFAYADDAYRLLGIKKEIVALYAQAGEQMLRDKKPKQAAMSFFVASRLEDPIGPYYQYFGPQIHGGCMAAPDKCVTALSTDLLLDASIRFLLSNESLANKLGAAAGADQKHEILGVLATCVDPELSDMIKKLRSAVDAFPKSDDGDPEAYAEIGPSLIGRLTVTGQAWQYLKEFCTEHPLGSLCVCLRFIRETPVIIPVIRDGKSIVESLLPPEFLKI